MSATAALLALLLGIGALPQPPVAMRDASRDSVSVLLMALETPRSISISSASPITVGDEARSNVRAMRAPLKVVAAGSLLELAGSTRKRLILSSSLKPLVLVAGDRRRTTTGRVELEAVDGALRIVARVPIRDYLAGVLVSESERGDPVEYLAALSALQRNYATSHRNRHGHDADLCDNTHCQRYSLDGAGGSIYRAVDMGSRLALGSPGALPCYYSVNCGGLTLTPRDVWGEFEAGYLSVTCTTCRSSRWYRWKRSIAATPAVDRLMRTAPPTPFVDDDFKISVGRAIGFNVVLSNTVDRISRRGSVYQVEGRGFGHRVGLCQDGARQLARIGRDGLAILRHYFPAASARRVR